MSSSPPLSPPYGVVSTTHFESGPPASKVTPGDTSDLIESVKEEEWEERRKKTTTTTRNVERRVQRHLVLEDGHVVGDTGEVVTEDKTEDTVVKDEHSNQNEKPEGQLSIDGPGGSLDVNAPVAGSIVVCERNTKTVKSRDHTDTAFETEEIMHCGDVTNKEAKDHLRGKTDLRALKEARSSKLALGDATDKTVQKPLPQVERRVIRDEKQSKGHIDTLDEKETSRVEDGHVVTETARTVRQETYSNRSAPSETSELSDGSAHEDTKETSHALSRTKDEHILEYYAVPKGATLAQGVKLGEGMHVVSEDLHEDRQGADPISAASRRDTITRKPLNFHQEEKTRKKETDKWLEHHFGSDSGRSDDSDHNSAKHSAGRTNRRTQSNSACNSTQATHDSASRSSSHPGKLYSTGGNRITITMNPEDNTTPKWGSDKVDRARTNSREIQDSELAAARSRLRYTGRKLDVTEDKENSAPGGGWHMTTETNETHGAIQDSRFIAGKPQGNNSPPVGRSRSFHVGSPDYNPVYNRPRTAWSPPRAPTPPPPPKPARVKKVESFYGREMATQTPTPVPPPRTKRRKDRPHTTYFFGALQPNEQNYANQSRHTSQQNGISEGNNNWTVDPRRKPRVSQEYRATTLPRKQNVEIKTTREHKEHKYDDNRRSHEVNNKHDHKKHAHFEPIPKSTKKTYIFGQKDSLNDYNTKSNHRGDSYYNQTEESRVSTMNRLNQQHGSPQNVGRSHSFNVHSQGPPNRVLTNTHNGELKRRSVYGSTPYVNLRSPNMIATLTRTGSIKEPGDEILVKHEHTGVTEEKDEKRERFMKGLLNTAPELFHFIHGENDSPDGQTKVPKDNRRAVKVKAGVDAPSPYSPPVKGPSSTYSATVFTFGKGNNTLTRSGPAEEQTSSTRDSHSGNNSTINTSNHHQPSPPPSNRRSTFNLKTSGSSLLYSPSFREQLHASPPPSPVRTAHKNRSSEHDQDISSKIHEIPVKIEVRDWNRR